MDGSWGRDTDAVYQALFVVRGQVGEAMDSMMKSQPSGIAPTVDQVTGAVRGVHLSEDQRIVLGDVRLVDRAITLPLIGYASGIDPVDTRRTVEGKACVVVTIDLDQHYPVLATSIDDAPCPTTSRATSSGVSPVFQVSVKKLRGPMPFGSKPGTGPAPCGTGPGQPSSANDRCARQLPAATWSTASAGLLFRA